MLITKPAFLLGLVVLIRKLDNHLLLIVGVDGEVEEGWVGEFVDVDGRGGLVGPLHGFGSKLFSRLMNQR